MDIFDISIVEIYSVEETPRFVAVNMKTDCYGGKETKTYYFNKASWDRIRHKKSFRETEGHDKGYVDYIESLSDDEYYSRFQKTLKDYTDKEICEEFNRRANGRLFHNISLSVDISDGVVKSIRASKANG